MFSTKLRGLITTLSYGFGSIPYGTTGSILGFYLNIFLLDIVKLDPLFVAIIILVGRVWDALTDPIIGYVLIYTPWTKFGRLKPWIFVGFLPMSVFYLLLWQNFSFQNDTLIFLYYFVVYLLFQTCTTIYHLPFTALILSLSNNLNFRDSATVVRMLFEVIGVFIGVSSHTIFLASFQNGTIHCDDFRSNSTFEVLQNRSGYFWSALFNSILIIITGSFLLIGTKEIKPISKSVTSVSKQKIKLRQIIQGLSFRPYYILLLVYMFSWLSLQLLQGNFAIFAKHVLRMESDYIYLLTVLVFSMIFSMFPWQILMFFVGKKLTLILGSLIVLFSLLVLLLFLDHTTIFLNYLFSVFAGIGVSTFYLVPWSMLPDVTDAAFLKMGFRMDEIYFGFFVFFSKFGGGLALGISSLCLKFFGYDTEKCIQGSTVRIGVRLLMTSFPFVLICLAQFALVCYPISESKRILNHQLLMTKDKDEQNVETILENDRISDYNSFTKVIIKDPF